MKRIVIFTDGGVQNNAAVENVGAWAYVKQVDGKTIERSGIDLNTKSDAQELKACIEALKSIGDSEASVEIRSDSSYLVNGMKKWVHIWQSNNWRRGKYNPKPLLYLEHWQELHELQKRFPDLRFVKVKAHAGIDGNERADQLIRIAIKEYVATKRERDN